MSKKTEEITELLAPALQVMGCELWGCEWISQGPHSLLRVYIEKPNGVSAEDCAEASRQVSAILDVEDCVPGSYHLEVSSPGLIRSLFRIDQYEKYIGKKIKFSLRTAQFGNTRRQYSGVLEAVQNNMVVVVVDGASMNFDFGNIEKASVDLI